MQKRGLHRKGLLVPNGIGDSKVDSRVEPAQKRDERLVRLIHIDQWNGCKAERRAHLIQRLPRGSIHRHAERH